MPKAFLSHSSIDKEYVSEVAAALGRARVHIDEKSFDAGSDFRTEIRRTLDDSECFVFFVSPDSLESVWCKFELDEAELRAARGTLRRSLAIFLGDIGDIGLLPEWLRRVKAVANRTPAQSARAIQAVLNRIRPDADRPFIGRNDELQRGVRKLASGEPLPRILVAHGLEGVGRRTYLSQLVQHALSLDMGPVLAVPEAGTLEDLFIASSSSVALLSRSDLEAQLEAFRSRSIDQQAEEIARHLAFIARDNCAPCILDRGAMLDASGDYRYEFAAVLEAFIEHHEDVYVCLVHARSPGFRNSPVRAFFFERRLNMLEPPDAQALVSRLLRDGGLTAKAETTAVLGAGTGGYPPAAYFIASQVEKYGVDVVASDQSALADFHSRSFTKFLRDLTLGEDARQLLRYLAAEDHLTLAGIAVATGQTIEAASDIVRALVDLCLINVVDDEYAVSAPIRAAIRRVEPSPSRSWYEKAFGRLEDAFWNDDDALPPLSVVDATLTAGLRIGKNRLAGYGTLVRPSLLVRGAEEMYFQREYELALEYTARAESMAPPTPPLLEIKIKSLAQLGRLQAARSALREYRHFGERRQWYLDAFIDRKGGEHATACSKFQRGYGQGDRSISVLRDYADSLLQVGAHEEARGLVEEGLERQSASLYLLDLRARIEIADGSDTDAEAALDALEEVDHDRSFIPQRRAQFLLLRRGDASSVRSAIALAREATEHRNSSVASHILLARALIKARRWSELDEVRRDIERKSRRSRGGLQRVAAYEALERKQWRRAEQALLHMPKGAARDSFEAATLELKAEDLAVSLTDRDDATARAEAIREKLGPLKGQLTPEEIDLYE